MFVYVVGTVNEEPSRQPHLGGELMTRTLNWFVLALITGGLTGLGLVGCGGRADVQFAEVDAVVLLDGKPIEGATVTLVPVSEGQGVSATGRTDASGRARLLPTESGGKVQGEYYVGVAKSEVPQRGEEEEEESSPSAEQYSVGPELKHIVPKRYNNPRESGIRVSIAPGQREVRIELTSGES